MDREGVRLLGAALYHWLCYRRNEAAKDVQLCKAEKENPTAISDLNLLFEPEHYDRELSSWDQQAELLKMHLNDLEVSDEDFSRSETLRAKDFRFRWDILMEHKALMSFITDDQPKWARSHDRDTPISKRWEDALTHALTSVFYSEYKRLSGPYPEEVPDLRTAEEFFFHLAAWKLCEPEKGKGAPRGRRKPDGLSNAASHAWSIRDVARRNGVKITMEEAMREALRNYSVIGSDEYEDFQEKEHCIVSDAAGPDGPIGAVKKLMRKMMNAMDRQASWDD